MKKTSLLIAATFLSVGTFVYVQAQDIDPKAPEPQASEESQSVEETGSDSNEGKKLAGIRTDEIVSRKFDKKGEEVTVAPIGSIFTESGKYFVLAKGAESDIDFQQREVKVGITDGTFVEITEGLFPGDEVITVAVNQLKFPAFDEDCNTGVCGPEGCPIDAKGKNGNCGPNGCPIDAKGKRGSCDPKGDCGYTVPADELFSSDFEEDFGPGPVFGYGPGSFCPPY